MFFPISAGHVGAVPDLRFRSWVGMVALESGSTGSGCVLGRAGSGVGDVAVVEGSVGSMEGLPEQSYAQADEGTA